MDGHCRCGTGRVNNVQSAQEKKRLRASGWVAAASVVSALVGLVACGGREVPATWPESSAASPAAKPAPAATVTRALDGPPPLPGENAAGWTGLATPSEPAHEHAGHGAAHDTPATDRAGDDRGAHEPAGAAARYVCPMHPDVVAQQPGTCPRCGMALVKRDAPK
jgi:hypothetical protein